MTIIFICSSLEPGRDGIGDYTRRLAAELIKCGHSVRIIAINEQSLSANQEQLQEADGVTVSVLRLSRLLSWADRLNHSQRWLHDFPYDWLSVQFGPFAYHKRGLCRQLGGQIEELAGGRPVHWMFHEIWMPWREPFPLKHRLLGYFQKRVLQALMDKYPPAVATSQLAAHCDALASIGVGATLLPLHGNIPVHPCGSPREWLRVKLGGVSYQAAGVIVGFFGNILPTLSLELVRKVLSSLGTSHRKVLVLSAGGLGASSQLLWDNMKNQLADLADFQALGRCGDNEISYYLQALDWGLTSYPGDLAGKSGAVAAMLEHRVSVKICGSWQADGSCEVASIEAAGNRWGVVDTAARFLDLLKNHNHHGA